MVVTTREGMQRLGATRTSPKVSLGYHGTPSRNTDAIMQNGFCPGCRRSAGDGAYFSGELSYSVSYARRAGGPQPGDVFLVALIDYGYVRVFGVVCLPWSDRTLFPKSFPSPYFVFSMSRRLSWPPRRTSKKPGTHVIMAQGAVFREENALPLARLRGF